MDKLINSVKAAVDSASLSGVEDLACPRRENSAGSDLKTLSVGMRDCSECALARTRTNLVFGEGDPDAKLMFIGEAPGAEEDKQGRPFVGRAGKLLGDIIEAMGLSREQVYIANILKCRPPGNRNPEASEMARCIPILFQQIKIISPSVICTLGKFASQTLLDTEEPIGKIRGEFRECKGFVVMPTYHPAYLLRNPSSKKDLWADMKKVASLLGIEVSGQKKRKT